MKTCWILFCHMLVCTRFDFHFLPLFLSCGFCSSHWKGLLHIYIIICIEIIVLQSPYAKMWGHACGLFKKLHFSVHVDFVWLRCWNNYSTLTLCKMIRLIHPCSHNCESLFSTYCSVQTLFLHFRLHTAHGPRPPPLYFPLPLAEWMTVSLIRPLEQQ